METKFKPFDKVLVRDDIREVWKSRSFDRMNADAESCYKFECQDGLLHKYCILFEGNEHLYGTTDDYVEPFEPKDGDFLNIHSMSEKICIYQKQKDGVIYTYIDYGMVGRMIRNNQEDKSYYGTCYSNDVSTIRLATEEEKQKLLDALHKEGKDWDAEKKEIVDYKWKPKERERYYLPYYTDELGFSPLAMCNLNKNILERNYDKGWVCQTKEECQVLCDRLNEAIKNVK